MPSIFGDPVARAPEDVWEALLYECSFGDIRIDVQSTSDANGRVLATYEYPHRDGASIEDMGGEPRVTRARVIFFQVSPDDDPHARFALFSNAKDRGEAQLFVHPITGTYRARIGAFDWSATADERGVIIVECTFHEDDDVPAIFEIAPGISSSVGAADVSAAAAAASASLADYNAGLVEDDPDAEPFESTAIDEAAELAAVWEATDPDELNTRDVTLALAEVTNKLQDAVDAWELASDLDSWPVMQAFSNLVYTLRLAAESATVDTPQIVDVRVLTPSPLYVVCQRTYGGADAEARFEQLMRMNDIPNPARLEEGTVLRAPSTASSSRLRSPV